jgi:peptidoglycan LD-endopeptidase LytH
MLATALAASLLVTPAAGQTTEQRLDRARAERSALEERLGEVTAELEALSVKLEDAQATRARLRAEVAALEAAAAAAEEAVVARAVHAFTRRQPGFLELLMAAEDPFDTIVRARLLLGASRREQELVERADAARTSLRQRRAELAEVVGTLSADEERIATLRAELDAAFGEARAREHELASRRDRQRQISRGRQQGTYACPIERPFHFRDTWGAPRSGGRRHRGTDVFAPMGHPVYAFTHGAIARHSNSRLGGLGLYLRGDDGNTYYYAHLQRIAPGHGPGRRVEAGELIAYNGDSGNARGGAPHVHFEMYPGGGGAVNPYPALAAACF